MPGFCLADDASLPIFRAGYLVLMANTRSRALGIRLKQAPERRLARLEEASGRSALSHAREGHPLVRDQADVPRSHEEFGALGPTSLSW